MEVVVMRKIFGRTPTNTHAVSTRPSIRHTPNVHTYVTVFGETENPPKNRTTELASSELFQIGHDPRKNTTRIQRNEIIITLYMQTKIFPSDSGKIVSQSIGFSKSVAVPYGYFVVVVHLLLPCALVAHTVSRRG